MAVARRVELTMLGKESTAAAGRERTRPVRTIDAEGVVRDHRAVHALADCSVAVLLVDAETENLGIVHAPWPLEPGDLLALADGPPLRVTVLAPLPAGGKVEALAEVEPAALERRPA
jgi:hypothetical protein